MGKFYIKDRDISVLSPLFSPNTPNTSDIFGTKIRGANSNVDNGQYKFLLGWQADKNTGWSMYPAFDFDACYNKIFVNGEQHRLSLSSARPRNLVEKYSQNYSSTTTIYLNNVGGKLYYNTTAQSSSGGTLIDLGDYNAKNNIVSFTLALWAPGGKGGGGAYWFLAGNWGGVGGGGGAKALLTINLAPTEYIKITFTSSSGRTSNSNDYEISSGNVVLDTYYNSQLFNVLTLNGGYSGTSNHARWHTDNYAASTYSLSSYSKSVSNQIIIRQILNGTSKRWNGYNGNSSTFPGSQSGIYSNTTYDYYWGCLENSIGVIKVTGSGGGSPGDGNQSHGSGGGGSYGNGGAAGDTGSGSNGSGGSNGGGGGGSGSPSGGANGGDGGTAGFKIFY